MQPAQSSTAFIPGQSSGPAPDAAGRAASSGGQNSADSFNLVMARTQAAKPAAGSKAAAKDASEAPTVPSETGETSLEAGLANTDITTTNTAGTGSGKGLAGAPAGALMISQLDSSAQRPDPAAANPFPAGLAGDTTVPPQAPVEPGMQVPGAQTPGAQTGGKPVPAKMVADPGIPADATSKSAPQTQIAEPGANTPAGKPVPGTQIADPQGRMPAGNILPLAKPAEASPLDASASSPAPAPALKSAENNALNAQTVSIAAGQTRPEGGKSQPNTGAKAASATKPSAPGSSPAASAASATGLPSTSAAPDAVQPASDLQTSLPKAQQAPAPAAQPALDGSFSRQPAAEPALPFRSDAELRLNQPNLQANIERSAQTTPRFTPQSAQQLAAQITRRFDAGSRVFDIRLDPAELGRVDVRLELMPDQRVQAILSAERQETLAELQRSAKDLVRALSEAGLDLADDGLSFQLSEDNDPSGFADESSEGVMNVYAETDDILLDGADTDQPPVSAYGFLLTGRDRVNVMA